MRWNWRVTGWVLVLGILIAGSRSSGLIITGGKGVMTDHNWPLGAVAMTNLQSRFGYWEGPPFGGGEWQFAYRGDAMELEQSLEMFAKIRAPELRVVIHEGTHVVGVLKGDGPNASGRADWTFTVWDPNSWNNLYNNPKSVFSASDPGGRFREPVAPPTLDVYVAGRDEQGLQWERVTVPAGLTVVDERATSAGYKAEDGSVIKGDVFNMATSKPIADARIILSQYVAKGDNTPGAWEKVVEGTSDEMGAFEMKKVPPGSYQVSVAAHDYIERQLGYVEVGSNTLKKYVTQLARPVTISGVVRDPAGAPVAGIKLAAHTAMGRDGRGYLKEWLYAVSGADGRFEFAGLPDGYFQVHATSQGRYLLDPLKLHDTRDELALVMTATGTVKGKVIRGGKKGPVYVQVHAASGDVIGTWGGSKMAEADGTFTFDDVPPGKYVVSADSRPTQKPEGKEIEVKVGETVEVEVQAR